VDARLRVHARQRRATIRILCGTGTIVPLRTTVQESPRGAESAQRYRDAADFAADIDRYLAGDPVVAYREPLHDRIARFYRQHHIAILLVLTYLLMRVLLIAFG
jgi:hypothetical protein